jgi:hypothetical protein
MGHIAIAPEVPGRWEVGTSEDGPALSTRTRRVAGASHWPQAPPTVRVALALAAASSRATTYGSLWEPTGASGSAATTRWRRPDSTRIPGFPSEHSTHPSRLSQATRRDGVGTTRPFSHQRLES